MSDISILKRILAATPKGDAAKALWPQLQKVAEGDLSSDQVRPVLEGILAEFKAKRAAGKTV